MKNKKPYFVKTQWLNNVFIRCKDIKLKPCEVLRYCPYGQLVEEFPIRKKRNKYSCEIFGHDCPVYYHAEFYNMDAKKIEKRLLTNYKKCLLKANKIQGD